MAGAMAEEVKVGGNVGVGTAVFEAGKLRVEVITKEAGHEALSPPKPVLIVSPADAGTYPVAVFLHGFFLLNDYYKQLLRHVASHGFILVAPQLYTVILPNSTEDIEAAAAVTDWLPTGLPALLPDGVKADLRHLALAGHSRGGHAAFSLALGHAKTTLKYSLLLGLDPVAGTGKSSQIAPEILTYKPDSFELGGMPVLVLGTGLGPDKELGVLPACAPDGVNHEEFYYECKPPCYHVVVAEYGHLDMLDDDAPKLVTCVCKSGNSCRDLMRRSTAGVVVAFLEAYLLGEEGDLKAILTDPGVAPAKLGPVEYRVVEA